MQILQHSNPGTMGRRFNLRDKHNILYILRGLQVFYEYFPGAMDFPKNIGIINLFFLDTGQI
jgi:hypothetical protein